MEKGEERRVGEIIINNIFVKEKRGRGKSVSSPVHRLPFTFLSLCFYLLHRSLFYFDEYAHILSSW